MVTFSIKHEISHFYLVVVLKLQRNVKKSLLFFLLCLFDVLVAAALLDLKGDVTRDNSQRRFFSSTQRCNVGTLL